ncbi:MAG: hypothetical protein JXR59_05925 [Desulfuromonadaceae bacterium]|nr:hypothetical protein [Desulfuromonadaceae bacterium]
MNRLLMLFAVWCLLVLPTVGGAVDLYDAVQIHGFFSQGYLHSHNNNFLAHSRSGSLKFTDCALNLNWQPLDALRLGAQAFYRNLGDYNENAVVLDWGLVEYQPKDWIGLRLGKIKMPLGLYNETRDASFVLPMVFLPQSIYDESRRDLTLAYLGAGLFGNVALGRFGDVDYHLFWGESSYPDESILQESSERSLENTIVRNSQLSPSRQNPLIPDSFSTLDRANDKIRGAALVWNLLPELRFGASLLHSESEIKVDSDGVSLVAVETTVHGRYVLSAEYHTEQWLLAAEYSESDRTMESFGETALDGPSQSWYVMLCYFPHEQWTISLLYDEFYREKHDKHSDSRPQVRADNGWRKDIGLGLRYDVNSWCNLKLEYHYIDGSAMQLNILNEEDVKRYWSYVVAQLAVVF